MSYVVDPCQLVCWFCSKSCICGSLIVFFCDLFLVAKAAWLRAVDSTSYFAGVVPHQCGWSHQLSDMICLALVRVVYFFVCPHGFLFVRTVSLLSSRRSLGFAIVPPKAGRLRYFLPGRARVAIVLPKAARFRYCLSDGPSFLLFSCRRPLGFATP